MRGIRRRDGGFTLVELLVYMVLVMVIMGIAATLFLRMLYVQRDVKAIADSNNASQLVFKQVERDLRNAVWAVVDDNGQLLVMQTRAATDTNDDIFFCVGYFYDSVSGELRRTLESTAVSGTETKAALDASNLAEVRLVSSDWTKDLRGVAAVGSVPIFGPLDGTFESPRYVTVSMAAATTDDHDPITFVKDISLRPQGSGAPSCR